MVQFCFGPAGAKLVTFSCQSFLDVESHLREDSTHPIRSITGVCVCVAGRWSWLCIVVDRTGTVLFKFRVACRWSARGNQSIDDNVEGGQKQVDCVMWCDGENRQR